MALTINNIFLEKKQKKPQTINFQNTIIIDFREKNSFVPIHLLKSKTPFEFKELKVGDYIIGETIIERKESKDFIQSIFNKRLFDQLNNLKEQKSPLLLIEGKLEKTPITQGTLLSIALKYKIPTVFTKNAEETASLLSLINKKNKTKHSLNPSRKAKTKKEELEIILESFPQIGPINAKNLLKEFKSLKAIFNATEEKIKKILKSKAMRFIKTLNSTYP